MSRLAVAPLLLLTALAGCGTADDRTQARATVERFYDAVRSGDAASACEEVGEGLLEAIESATQQSCRGVITRFEYEGGEVTGTEVYMTAAKVDLSGGESVFLSREDAGWKLSALACRAEEGKPADRPWECEADA
jgi:hypothetical protein